MKKLLITLGMFSLLGTAYAADISAQPRNNKATVLASWDGAYIGGYVGVMQGKSSTTVDGWTDNTPITQCEYDWKKVLNEWSKVYECEQSKHKYVQQTYPGATSPGNPVGVMFGGILGVNKTWGHFLAGGEVDGGYSGARACETVYNVVGCHKMPWNLNVALRAGFLVGPSMDTLLYGKGGLAVIQQQTDLTGSSGTVSESKTKLGWILGGGIEHKFNPKLMARVEGLYRKVSDQTVVIPGAQSTLKGDSWDIKVGLTTPLN